MNNKYSKLISIKSIQPRTAYALNVKHNGVTHKDVLTNMTKGYIKPIRVLGANIDRNTRDKTWDLDDIERFYKRGGEHSATAGKYLGAGLAGLKLLEELQKHCNHYPQ